MRSLSEVTQTEAQSGASVLVQKNLFGLVPCRAREACGVSLGLSRERVRTTHRYVRTTVISSFAQQMLALLEQFYLKRWIDLKSLKRHVFQGLETELRRKQAAFCFGHQIQQHRLMRTACPLGSRARALQAGWPP